jgi:plasmid stabilization system protein ParE
MRIVLSDRALADLAAIGDWIAEDNPARADSFVQELLDACESLAEFPERYPLLARSKRPLRHRVYGRHLVIYDVTERGVTIITIAHGARDLDMLLG